MRMRKGRSARESAQRTSRERRLREGDGFTAAERDGVASEMVSRERRETACERDAYRARRNETAKNLGSMYWIVLRAVNKRGPPLFGRIPRTVRTPYRIVVCGPYAPGDVAKTYGKRARAS